MTDEQRWKNAAAFFSVSNVRRAIQVTAKQVGERIRERRTELRLSMSQLGDRLGVNKSTIQRYETGGVDPERTILIVPIAEALETTPEWLTGKSDAKEYDSYTLCKKAIEQHISDYLDSMTSAVQGQPHQQRWKHPWKI